MGALDSALQLITFKPPTRETFELFSAAPSKQFLSTILGRQIVRDDILHMRRLVMTAAIKNAKSAQPVPLKNLSAEEKQATLLLLLLQLKDGFVKPHVEKCCILENTGGSCSMLYIVHATLLCRCAIKHWTTDALDKFLIGDLGAIEFSQSNTCCTNSSNSTICFVWCNHLLSTVCKRLTSLAQAPVALQRWP